MTIKKKQLICEIGLNHLGNKKLLNEYLIYLAKKNIFGITIQILKKEFFFNKKFSKLILSEKVISSFISLVKSKKIKVGIAIDDINQIDFFIEKKIDFYKILSKDVENVALINKAISSNKKVFISTGNSTVSEIDKLLNNINLNKNVRLIYTSFSKKINNIKLEKIQKLQKKFNIPVSYGNHSPYVGAIVLSCLYKPEFVFAYIKMDNNKLYPDHDHAIKLENIDEILYYISILNKTVIKKNDL